MDQEVKYTLSLNIDEAAQLMLALEDRVRFLDKLNMEQQKEEAKSMLKKARQAIYEVESA